MTSKLTLVDTKVVLMSEQFDADSAYGVGDGPSDQGILGGLFFGGVITFREVTSGAPIDCTVYGAMRLNRNFWRICGCVTRTDLKRGRKADYFAEISTQTRQGWFQFALV